MAVSHRGAISFGMVHIPVGLYTKDQDNDIYFNPLRKENGCGMTLEKSPRFAMAHWIEKQGIAFCRSGEDAECRGDGCKMESQQV